MFHFDSVFKIQNRTRQCFCIDYIDHACRMQAPISSKFYKVLQISVRPNMCYIFLMHRAYKLINTTPGSLSL